MRSRADARAARGFIRALIVASIALSASTFAATEERAAPAASEIAAAVETLQADPNLATERETRILRWKGEDDEDEPATEPAQWLLDLMKWIGESGRFIVWLVIAVLVGLLVVLIVRVVREFRPAQRARRFEAPTHIQELDIRPESLPDDVGAAALDLWRQGEHRAALSLLYRGTLSRMVHAYELPVRASMTEGDCVELARDAMDGVASGYVARLVRLWQLAVYGGYEPSNEDVQSLCRDFGMSLRASAPDAVTP